MPRGYAQSRRDSNHAALVRYAQQIGFTVLETHAIAGGLDLLVGIGGKDQRVEIKDPNKPPSARKLTAAELKAFKSWRGRQPAIWMSTDDVDDTRRDMLGIALR